MLHVHVHKFKNVAINIDLIKLFILYSPSQSGKEASVLVEEPCSCREFQNTTLPLVPHVCVLSSKATFSSFHKLNSANFPGTV